MASASCGDDVATIRIYYERYCATPEQMQCFGQRMVELAQAANPKSDEEPEDWLPNCQKMSREACCPLTKGVLYQYKYTKAEWLPWSMASAKDKAFLSKGE